MKRRVARWSRGVFHAAAGARRPCLSHRRAIRPAGAAVLGGVCGQASKLFPAVRSARFVSARLDQIQPGNDKQKNDDHAPQYFHAPPHFESRGSHEKPPQESRGLKSRAVRSCG
ncbi:hypothetical protein GVO57_00795 [Sphingomonas changnyeongensis]|uniref:Uncharacterized protein n=1 Tax=Sphingomonas changnyeongensis TaxID=2698679 RepID=A0A7Z2S7H5_9SPHN|nr:hypothetical protein [Sphingomonas changnyeongensis]QHL89622.1 hypothetical protein GVO57_00795 [Sphingomonas changnyeongensis]